MSGTQTSSHRSSKFLFILLFILYINGVSCWGSFETESDNELSTVNTTDDALRQFNGVNSTWQDVNGESQRQGRFFNKDSRLFGARRRIQFALLPIMFKLGVISTMLVGLTVMMLKGLTIGVILLFFALGNSLLKYKYHHQQQPVHFHLHPGGPHSSVPVYHGYGHGEQWDKASEQSETAPAFENYDPAGHHRTIPYRYPPYRYPYHDPYAYHGR